MVCTTHAVQRGVDKCRLGHKIAPVDAEHWNYYLTFLQAVTGKFWFGVRVGWVVRARARGLVANKVAGKAKSVSARDIFLKDNIPVEVYFSSCDQDLNSKRRSERENMCF